MLFLFLNSFFLFILNSQIFPGAGHAIGTPFIELGKVVRSAIQPSYKNVSDCVVAWTCCDGGGSWARGCKYCNETTKNLL
jgi:hypothetical protein